MRWILIMLLFAGCGDSSPIAPNDFDGDGYEVGVDCCDIDVMVNPSNHRFYSEPNLCGHYDYDCNGMEELENQDIQKCFEGSDWCGQRQIGWEEYIPQCGESDVWVNWCGDSQNCRLYTEPKIQACR